MERNPHEPLSTSQNAESESLIRLTLVLLSWHPPRASTTKYLIDDTQWFKYDGVCNT